MSVSITRRTILDHRRPNAEAPIGRDLSYRDRDLVTRSLLALNLDLGIQTFVEHFRRIRCGASTMSSALTSI